MMCVIGRYPVNKSCRCFFRSSGPEWSKHVCYDGVYCFLDAGLYFLKNTWFVALVINNLSYCSEIEGLLKVTAGHVCPRSANILEMVQCVLTWVVLMVIWAMIWTFKLPKFRNLLYMYLLNCFIPSVHTTSRPLKVTWLLMQSFSNSCLSHLYHLFSKTKHLTCYIVMFLV